MKLVTVWSSLSVTGAATSWGIDGKLVSTPSHIKLSDGVVASATNNTLTVNGKNWLTNQWVNYQVRIDGGDGIGQVRTIISNTLNTITLSTNWTSNPNNTSTYEISGHDDYLYLLGNGSVIMYRYTISTNSWTTITPTVARNGIPGAGMSANWVFNGDSLGWSDENNLKNGAYIYSFMGTATSRLHRYDISFNRWEEVNYNNQVETFWTGSSYSTMNGFIYIRKESTGRMFRFNLSGNNLEPLTTTLYPDSTAHMGDKMWGVTYVDSNGNTKLRWLYWIHNNTNILQRMLIY